MTYAKNYLAEATQIIQKLDINIIEKIVHLLIDTRKNNGRLFILGVGGSRGEAPLGTSRPAHQSKVQNF